MRVLLRILLWPIKTLFGGSRKSASYPSAVEYIVDGDTINDRSGRIRILDIDAPEMSQMGGHAARDQLRKLIGKQVVIVRPEGKDIYGRTLAHVQIGRMNLGQAMVASGYAVANGPRYAKDEILAKKSRAGLWAADGITCPAAHRRARA